MEDRVGLCKTCAFSRVVTSGRGSRFYLCRLSETDPRFARYPRLPVLKCAGYREGERDHAAPPASGVDKREGPR